MEFRKQAQAYHGKTPLIVLGSGASAAYGMSGMYALGQHLIKTTDLTGLDASESAVWDQFSTLLTNNVDLEAALQKVPANEKLTSRIIRATWSLIHNEDLLVYRSSLLNPTMFSLSRLLGHLFNSSLTAIHIVTTNYDRLAEYACEHQSLHHYTGFSHGHFRRLAEPNELKAARKVNIWKVHGSLDWFQPSHGNTVAFSNVDQIPDRYEPQIVTPGTQKYQKTHLEPYRSIMSHADQAMKSANAYLCIGYGFNDEHIQPKLMDQCLRNGVPLTVVTHTLSNATKDLIRSGRVKNYLAIERGAADGQSTIYSSLEKNPISVNEGLWNLDGYLSLVT